MLREDLSRLVVLAPSVHPSSRLPLIVQHLLVAPGVPPTLLSPQSPAPTLGLYMEFGAFWDSSSWFLGLPLVPGYIYFIPLVPPTH